MTTWQPGLFVADERLAEEMAAYRMRELGHPDAQATAPGADSGIDVVARRAIAQVKYRAGITGRPDLQRLVGAREDNHAVELWFFSMSGYSAQAIEYGDRLNIRLLTFDELGTLRSHNVAGQRALLPPTPTQEYRATRGQLRPTVPVPGERSSSRTMSELFKVRTDRPPSHTAGEYLKLYPFAVAASIFALAAFIIGINAYERDEIPAFWGPVFVVCATSAVVFGIIGGVQIGWRDAQDRKK